MNRLDVMYGAFLEAPHTPIKINLGDSITFGGKTDDAFMLKSPVAGCINSVEVSKVPEKDGCLVIRALFGYRTGKEIETDIFKGFTFLSLLKNEMMSQAAQYINLSEVESYTFKRPGPSSGFFFEVGDIAAYELRFYAKFKDTNTVTGGN